MQHRDCGPETFYSPSPGTPRSEGGLSRPELTVAEGVGEKATMVGASVCRSSDEPWARGGAVGDNRDNMGEGMLGEKGHEETSLARKNEVRGEIRPRAGVLSDGS